LKSLEVARNGAGEWIVEYDHDWSHHGVANQTLREAIMDFVTLLKDKALAV
jgi:hypothetical protein